MKLLTLNFITCARKACKPHASSFPLHPKNAELEIVEADINTQLIVNILPRLDWPALVGLCTELGLTLRETVPEATELVVKEGEDMEVEGTEKKEEEEELEPTQLAKDLHRLLWETSILTGELVCANCGHEYAIKEGIANFLLPSHLV
ncbi:glucose-regulated [Venturia inaequalis]|nr:glucose-regulated [Venturia inaequalis]